MFDCRMIRMAIPVLADFVVMVVLGSMKDIICRFGTSMSHIASQRVPTDVFGHRRGGNKGWLEILGMAGARALYTIPCSGRRQR